MRRYRHYFYSLILFGSIPFLSATAFSYDAPPEIVSTLPRFCWGQYIPSAKDNPDFALPDCGAYVNHFCPGLVHMGLAQRAKEPRKKEVEYNMAKADMEYTLNFTQEYPECVLRPMAQRNLIRINSELELMKILQRNRRR
jgi:hypothetical protein